MTSDAPYPVEFIQIGGDGNQILNCQIYGPVQPGDSSTWVVNRGFVTQGNAINLPVRNNVFHMLRQPAYLNPGSVSIPKEGSAHSYMTLEGGLFQWKDLEGRVYRSHRAG